jgi:hypothetical protein
VAGSATFPGHRCGRRGHARTRSTPRHDSDRPVSHIRREGVPSFGG